MESNSVNGDNNSYENHELPVGEIQNPECQSVEYLNQGPLLLEPVEQEFQYLDPECMGENYISAAPRSVSIYAPSSAGQTFFPGDRIRLGASVSGATWARIWVVSNAGVLVFRWEGSVTTVAEQMWTIPINITRGTHTLRIATMDSWGEIAVQQRMFIIGSSTPALITMDSVAINHYFRIHGAIHPNVINQECGAAIRSGPTMGPIQMGRQTDVVRVILNAAGINPNATAASNMTTFHTPGLITQQHPQAGRTHEENIQRIALLNNNSNAFSEQRFRDDLDIYRNHNNLAFNVSNIIGIVHCHPRSAQRPTMGFSFADMFFTRFFRDRLFRTISLYGVLGAMYSEFWRFNPGDTIIPNGYSGTRLV